MKEYKIRVFVEERKSSREVFNEIYSVYAEGEEEALEALGGQIDFLDILYEEAEKELGTNIGGISHE